MSPRRMIRAKLTRSGATLALHAPIAPASDYFDLGPAKRRQRRAATGPARLSPGCDSRCRKRATRRSRRPSMAVCGTLSIISAVVTVRPGALPDAPDRLSKEGALTRIFQRRSVCRAPRHARRTIELALNPDGFCPARPTCRFARRWCHEMVHAWQQQHGRPGRGGYHNREWAAKMKEIGLAADLDRADRRPRDRAEDERSDHRRWRLRAILRSPRGDSREAQLAIGHALRRSGTTGHQQNEVFLLELLARTPGANPTSRSIASPPCGVAMAST